MDKKFDHNEKKSEFKVVDFNRFYELADTISEGAAPFLSQRNEPQMRQYVN